MQFILYDQTPINTTQIYRNFSSTKPLSNLSTSYEQSKGTLGVQVELSIDAYKLFELSIQDEPKKSINNQENYFSQYNYAVNSSNKKNVETCKKNQKIETKILDSNEEITSIDEGYKYLIYAVTWQPSFCKLKPETAGCHKPIEKFLTHGIWPYNDSTDYKTNRHPAFCDSSLSYKKPIEYQINSDILEKIASNPEISKLVTTEPINMFKHEWEKHGTCSGKSINDYFYDIVKLRSVVEYDKNKFDSWIGRSVMFNDMKSAFPQNTSFRCFIEKDKQYLHEVFYSINSDGTPYLKNKNLQIGTLCSHKETFIPGAFKANIQHNFLK